MKRVVPYTHLVVAPTTAQSPPRSIRVLPPLVAAQIAAGEVVERPASAVKELIENAIDARATRISIDLEQGGIELIRVADDGHGIAADELALAVTPHATSKLEGAADLERIATLGFRGEALASISAVARVTLRSRTSTDDTAHLIDAEGASISAARPEAGPVGTLVTVRNLFFNTPARRKFLRTSATELGHCTDAVTDLALSHPHIGFTLRAEGRTILDVPPAQDPSERALALLGPEMQSQYLRVSADRFDSPGGLGGVTLWGLIGRPALARPTTKAQHFFINGRAIRDRTIQHALKEAFRGLIEPSRHPAAVLMIEMEPGAVDVNVHPTKAEVRFRDSGLVHSVVHRAVQETLRAADLTPSVHWSGASGSGSQFGAEPKTGAMPLPSPAADPERFVDYFRRLAAPAGRKFDYESLRAAVDAAQQSAPALPEAPSAASIPLDSPPPMALPLPAHKVLQVHNSYLVTQDDQGVLIIDQHALHERAMFEALRDRLARGELESQRLLMPAVVSVSPQRLEALARVENLFARLGITAEPMGPSSLGVHSFPTFLFDRGVDAGEFVADVLERAEAEKWGDSPDAAGDEAALHEVLDMMACKAAVKAGDSLAPAELDALLALREHVERSSNCPHGRPTSIRLSIHELEKRFGRT